MQDWFYVQSASYGYYYIDIEINGYDVYRISMYHSEPGSGMLGYPVDQTTTGNKAYVKKRYRQFMQYAEDDMYGWNCMIASDPEWEFDESDWPSVAKFIIQ